MSNGLDISSGPPRFIVPFKPDWKAIVSTLGSPFAALTASARLPEPELSTLVTVRVAASALPAVANAAPSVSPPAASSRVRRVTVNAILQLLQLRASGLDITNTGYRGAN